MNDSLRISRAGKTLIREFEGCSLKAKIDSAGVWTVGYGHTNSDGLAPHVSSGLKVTEQEADEILDRDLKEVYEPFVKRIVKVPLKQNQFDALVSFCYNCGPGNLRELVQRLNAGDYASIPKRLPHYIRNIRGKVLRGLIRRRKAEAAMWRGLLCNKSFAAIDWRILAICYPVMGLLYLRTRREQDNRK